MAEKDGATARARARRQVALLAWWLLCLLLLATLFVDRLPTLIGPDPSAFDLGVAALLAALLIYPLLKSGSIGDVKVEPAMSFVEIGIEEVKSKVDALTTQVVFMASQRQYQNVTVTQGVLSPEALRVARPREDAGIEAMADALNIDNFADKAEQESVMTPSTAVTEIEALGEVVDRIEAQLRRIIQSAPGQSRPNVVAMASSLAKRNVLTPEVAGVIRNIVDIARVAQAGEAVSNEHVRYVKEMAPKLMVVLKTVPSAVAA